MHGEGFYTYANGDMYTGSFQQGIKHGKGSYYFKVYLGDLWTKQISLLSPVHPAVWEYTMCVFGASCLKHSAFDSQLAISCVSICSPQSHSILALGRMEFLLMVHGRFRTDLHTMGALETM